MKRIRLVGEELCRTFTTNNLVIETNSTIPTMEIETERQLIELKRKMADKDKEIRELRLRLMNSPSGGKQSHKIQISGAEEITPIDEA